MTTSGSMGSANWKISDSDWQKILDNQRKSTERDAQLYNAANPDQRWRSSFNSSGSSSIGGSGTHGAAGGSSASASFFDSSKMGGLLDTAKQFGEFGFGLQSRGWELANKYRMSEAGQQIEGQKDLANIGQSGETNRLGMSIAGEERLENTRQGGLNTRQQSQLAEQQRSQLAAFQNQTLQKAQDAARARLAFKGII